MKFNVDSIKKLAIGTKDTIIKYSPELLTGIGIAGFISTTVLAVKATPKATKIIEDAERHKNRKLKTIETVKVAGKCYIPTAVTGALSIACIIGARSVDSRRRAAIATAYALSEASLKEYKDKVIEVVGENKERAIRDEIAKDRIKHHPVDQSNVIITDKGTTLCYDTVSGRYFYSDIDRIRKAENELNHQINVEMYVSLNEFYDLLDLESVAIGDDIGWNANYGLVNINFSSQISSEGKPCLVLDYDVLPRYDYANLY